MTTKKVLKVKIGDAYDKDNNKSYPVYVDYWETDKGYYERSERIYIKEIELKKEESKTPSL